MEIEKDGGTSGYVTDVAVCAGSSRRRERHVPGGEGRTPGAVGAICRKLALHVAKIVSAGLIILGFGFFALFQLLARRCPAAAPGESAEDADQGQRRCRTR